MKKNLFFLLIVTCLSVQLRAQSIKGTRWILTEVYKDKRSGNALKDTALRAMLFFNSDTAYTGVYCNRYFGKCNISKDGKITMRHPTASRRYCQGGYSEWEGQLFGWYRSVTTYTLKSNLLILYTGKDEKLVFKKE